MFMLNELLIKDLSDQVDTNTSDIQDIKDAEVYSTNEVKTNKVWSDGKPIYRKTFMFGAMPNASTKTINTNISNLNRTVKLYGMAFRSSDNRAMTIPDSSPGNEISCNISGSDINIATTSDRSSFNDSHIIIEYTKTTD
jgi:hypothetical protein